MKNEVVSALRKGGAKEEVELWHIYKEYLNGVFKNGGKGRDKEVPVHPMLLNWTIAFLARTSASTYNTVKWVMKLPHISYVYRKTTDIIWTMGDKAFAINIDTTKAIYPARTSRWQSWRRRREMRDVESLQKNERMGGISTI